MGVEGGERVQSYGASKNDYPSLKRDQARLVSKEVEGGKFYDGKRLRKL